MISKSVRSCFPVAARVVGEKAEEINKLNVFPVPDGDTGTNMSLTLATVVHEVEALPDSASMEDVAAAITHGSLMGARGNSGVITSQILRGVAEGLVPAKGDQATPAEVAAALRNGVTVAFKAVRKPVEGTILTVLRDISAKADQLAKVRDMTTEEMLDQIVVEAYESVARTPDLLPVLKENGVVDSGAYGLATFIEAFVNAYRGRTDELTDFQTTVSADAKGSVANVVDIEINDDWEGSEFRYCTEFLFHADSPHFDEEACLRYFSTMGDCELLVGSNPDFKCHVHTNRPDRILRHMIHRGQVFNVFVHNMDLEAQERTEGIRADKEAKTEERKALGFVAVAAGSGEAEILTSLGVDVVVSGGQTMNPSTADILAAIESCNADEVIVLPNNGNIRMAAEAATSAWTNDKNHGYVVPTRSVLQAFAAMFTVDLEEGAAENVEAMTEALEGVRDGEVTTAVRDSQAADGSPIHEGDVMGIQDGAITVVGSAVEDVTIQLIERMQEEEEGDTLTILAGEDYSDEQFEALQGRIEEALPDLEIDAHRGEQPLYPIIFSIE